MNMRMCFVKALGRTSSPKSLNHSQPRKRKLGWLRTPMCVLVQMHSSHLATISSALTKAVCSILLRQAVLCVTTMLSILAINTALPWHSLAYASSIINQILYGIRERDSVRHHEWHQLWQSQRTEG